MLFSGIIYGMKKIIKKIFYKIKYRKIYKSMKNKKDFIY